MKGCTHGIEFRDAYGCEMCSLERSYRVIGQSVRRRKPKVAQLVENEGDAYYARELVAAATEAYLRRLKPITKVVKSSNGPRR